MARKLNESRSSRKEDLSNDSCKLPDRHRRHGLERYAQQLADGIESPAKQQAGGAGQEIAARRVASEQGRVDGLDRLRHRPVPYTPVQQKKRFLSHLRCSSCRRA